MGKDHGIDGGGIEGNLPVPLPLLPVGVKPEIYEKPVFFRLEEDGAAPHGTGGADELHARGFFRRNRKNREREEKQQEQQPPSLQIRRFSCPLRLWV